MTNEQNPEVVSVENNNEVETNVEDTAQVDETTKETERKEAETSEAREARERGIYKRLSKKYGETKPSSSNDLGEKAYLAVNGIKGADEVDFFQKMKKETGKDAESLLQSTYFQVEYKDFKEKKSTSNAIPTGSKRSNNSSVDSVEYWIAKGELPQGLENKELREKIVNTRMGKEQSKGVFYNS